MKKIAISAALLSLTALAACAPYPPGDCRYDNTCTNYPYNQNNPQINPDAAGRVYYKDRTRADYVVVDGMRYYPANDGYYYVSPDFKGDRYYYRDGYILLDDGTYVVKKPYHGRKVPPGGWNRPTQPENHPDKY